MVNGTFEKRSKKKRDWIKQKRFFLTRYFHDVGGAHIHVGDKVYNSYEELALETQRNQKVSGKTTLAEFQQASHETAQLRNESSSRATTSSEPKNNSNPSNSSRASTSTSSENSKSVFVNRSNSSAGSETIQKGKTRAENFSPKFFTSEPTRSRSLPPSPKVSVPHTSSRSSSENRGGPKETKNPTFSSSSSNRSGKSPYVSKATSSLKSSGNSISHHTSKTQKSSTPLGSRATSTVSAQILGSKTASLKSPSATLNELNSSILSLKEISQNPQLFQNLPSGLKGLSAALLSLSGKSGKFTPGLFLGLFAGVKGAVGFSTNGSPYVIFGRETQAASRLVANQALGFQGGMPLNFQGVQLNYPGLIQRFEKSVIRFFNILFGRFFSKSPILLSKENMALLSELGIVMTLKNRKTKKEKKVVDNKLKKKLVEKVFSKDDSEFSDHFSPDSQKFDYVAL